MSRFFLDSSFIFTLQVQLVRFTLQIRPEFGHFHLLHCYFPGQSHHHLFWTLTIFVVVLRSSCFCCCLFYPWIKSQGSSQSDSFQWKIDLIGLLLKILKQLSKSSEVEPEALNALHILAIIKPLSASSLTLPLAHSVSATVASCRSSASQSPGMFLA